MRSSTGDGDDSTTQGPVRQTLLPTIGDDEKNAKTKTKTKNSTYTINLTCA